MDIKKLAIAYATFIAMGVFTAMVVRPMVKKAEIPLLKDVL